MISGIKTKAGIIGVSENIVRGDCATLVVTTDHEHAIALMAIAVAARTSLVCAWASTARAWPPIWTIRSRR